MLLFGKEISLPKRYTLGTHRLCSPEETLERFRPLLPQFGITRIANVTGLDYGASSIPVYMAVRPNGRTLAVSQGKGFDHPSAMVSAMMEAIELWHAEHPKMTLFCETYAALRRRARVLDLERVLGAAGTTLDPNDTFLWAEGWDLMRAEPIHVPLEGFALARLGRKSSGLLQTTHGLASGNHLLEAALHGLCELIERDALHLFELEPRAERARFKVDLTTIEAPACKTLLEQARRAEWAVEVYDMSTDTRVPAYIAVIADDPRRLRHMGPINGFGAHPSAEVALARAISEAVQARLTFIAGARDDLLPSKDFGSGSRTVSEADYARFEQIQRNGSLDFRARPSLSTSSIEGDVEAVLDALREVGIDSVAVVDLSWPEYQVPVAKVIVPGLEVVAAFTPGERIARKLQELSERHGH